ncbi:MAG: mandelate racemase/muconate lactonizing enzyme family protein, partial [Chloroflexi bacterium]|nr:mandelate racemase/muconate lactonizing enzyme family protein [Chloroflexota bacterium]
MSARVRDVACWAVDVPQEEPVAFREGEVLTSIPHLVVRVRDADGAEGVGFAWTPDPAAMPGLLGAARKLAEALPGQEVLPGALRARLLAHVPSLPPSTLHPPPSRLALSALDCALWDLQARQLGLPLYRLLGGLRERVPAYASHGLWRGLSPRVLAENAARHVAEGYAAVKLRIGGEAAPEDAIERLRVVREAVGPSVTLLADVNARWTADLAARLVPRVAEFALGWLEDPMGSDEPAAMAALAAAGTPLATGENLGSPAELRRWLEVGAMDVAILDVSRLGGMAPWLEAAGVAEAFHRPVAGHVLPEIHQHLLAAVPNALTVEFVPRSSALWR